MIGVARRGFGERIIGGRQCIILKSRTQGANEYFEEYKSLNVDRTQLEIYFSEAYHPLPLQKNIFSRS